MKRKRMPRGRPVGGLALVLTMLAGSGRAGQDPPAGAVVLPTGVEGRSVAAYGAKGDGWADDTEALQSAIDAIPAAGGVVYLPVGVYRVTAPIRLRPQLRLVGATRRSWGDGPHALGSRILVDHEGHGLMLEFEKDTGGNIFIEHLGVGCFNRKYPKEDGSFYTRGHGIYFRNVYDVTLSNMDVGFAPEDNYHFKGGWHIYVRDCYSGHPGVSNWHVESPHNSLHKAVCDGGQYGLTIPFCRDDQQKSTARRVAEVPLRGTDKTKRDGSMTRPA